MNAPLHSRLGKCCISFFFFISLQDSTCKVSEMSRASCYWGFMIFSICSSWFWEMRKDLIPTPWWWCSFLISSCSGYCWWTLPVIHWAAGKLLTTMAFSTDLKSSLEDFDASLRTTNLVAGSAASACHAGNPIWVPVTLEYFIKHPWNQTLSLLPAKEIQHPQMMGFSSSLDPKTKSSSHFWDNPIQLFSCT